MIGEAGRAGHNRPYSNEYCTPHAAPLQIIAAYLMTYEVQVPFVDCFSGPTYGPANKGLTPRTPHAPPSGLLLAGPAGPIYFVVRRIPKFGLVLRQGLDVPDVALRRAAAVIARTAWTGKGGVK